MNDVLSIGLILAIFVGIVFIQMELKKRSAALVRLESKLDLLLSHAGLHFDPFANVPPSVAEALRRGEKIQAIKCYREATGVGLKEAKDFVEEIQRRAGTGV
jgi:hypothetical protein